MSILISRKEHEEALAEVNKRYLDLLMKHDALREAFEKEHKAQEAFIDPDATVNALKAVKAIRGLRRVVVNSGKILTKEGAMYFLALLEESILENMEIQHKEGDADA